MGFRVALLGESRSARARHLGVNKLRSALTVLARGIGITAIVGMTSLIRGFDQSLRDSIRRSGRTRYSSPSSAA